MRSYEWFHGSLHRLLPRIEDELQTMLEERDSGLSESQAHIEPYLASRAIAINHHIDIHQQAIDFIHAIPTPQHHTDEDFKRLIYEMVIGNLQHWHYEPVGSGDTLGELAREVFRTHSR